jgi:hypothetical protein
MFLPLISKSSYVRDRVRVVPALAGGKAAQSIGWARWPLAQDDRIAGHEDVEAIARLDAQFAAGVAGHDDLMLSGNLDA